MLQIDPLQFLFQAVALSAWVCIAAGLYSVVEKWLATNRDNP